jgi:hypothetical protein
MTNTESARAVVVAHRRPPVLRMIRTALEVEGARVLVASTASACLAALHTPGVQAGIIDADLLKPEAPRGTVLEHYLRRAGLPLLLLSWEPCDRALARRLMAAFSSRPDEVEGIIQWLSGVVAQAVLPAGMPPRAAGAAWGAG